MRVLLRASLHEDHKRLMKQGFVASNQLRDFQEAYDIYHREGDNCTLSNHLAFFSRLSKNPSVYKVGFGGNPARWFDDSSRIYHESVLLISNGLGWQPRSYMYGFCI